MNNIEFTARLNDQATAPFNQLLALIKKANGEVVNIKVMTPQIEKLTTALGQAENKISTLNNRKIDIKFQDAEVSRKISNLKMKLDELRDYRATLKVGTDDYKRASAEIKDVQTQIRNLTRARESLTVDTKEANANLAKTKTELDGIKSELREAESAASQAAGGMDRLASAGVSAGEQITNAFSKVGNFLTGAGGMLQGLGNMFGGKVVGTAKTMTTAFATMGLYSAAQGTVERYDTMRMFPKMMEHLGYSTGDAEQAIKDLEDAVIGLPTGLDEIVASARQLIPLTGDLNKGVNLAIAANNAFLAGGSDAQSVNYGQRQIKDLLAKGTLRSQEWDSLFTALGSGLGVIAEAMGYSSKATKGGGSINDEIKYAESRLKSLRNTQKRYEKEGGTAKQIKKNADAIKTWEAELKNLQGQQDKSLGSFRNALKTNQISALDFLDALEKVGTGQGELAKRADDYKDTISAAARNIKNALQKLGAAGLDALDNVLVEKTGKGIPGTIREISDSIKQNLVPALEGWVEQNGDKIVNFFDRLKNYDWIGLVSKVGKGLAKYYDILTNFFTHISPKVVSFLAVWAGPIGRFLSGAGGFVNGLGGVIGKIVDVFSKGKTSGKLAEAAAGAEDVAKIGINFSNAFKGLGLAAGITGEVAAIGGVIFEYAKIVEAISKMELGPNFDRNIGVISKTAGIGTLIAGALTAIFGGLSSIFPGFAPSALVGEGLAAGLVAIVSEIGGVMAEYAHIVNYIANMDIPSEGQVKELGKSVKTVTKELLGDIKKIPDRSVRSFANLKEITAYATDVAKELQKLKEVGNVGDMSKKIGNIIKAANAFLKGVEYDKDDEKESGIIAKTLGNVADATESIKTIVTTLTETKDSIKGLTDKQGMTDLKINLGLIFGSLLDNTKAGTTEGALARFKRETKEYATMKENLGTIAEAMTSVSSIFTTLVGARDNIAQLIKKDHGHFTTDIGRQIGTIINSLTDVFLDSKLVFNTSEYDIVKQNMGRFSDMTESISTIAKSLVDSLTNLNQLTQKAAAPGLYSMKDTDVSQKISAVLRAVKRVAKDISEMDDIDTSGTGKKKVTALAEVVGGLPELFTNLQAIVEPMASLGVNGDDWQLGDDLGTIISGLQEAFDNLSSADYADLKANAESLKGATDQLSGIMDGLQAVQEKIGGLGIADGVWQAGKDLGTAINTITGIFPENFGQTMAGGDMLAGVASNLTAVANTLGDLATNAGNASGNLDKATSSLDAFGKSAADHKKDIGEAATQTAKLKSALDGIFGKGMTAAMGVTAVGSAAGEQAWNLRSAASAAASLAAAISSIPSNKTINVTTNYATTNASGTGAASSGRHEVGGHITRASGGPVWGRGGIDNIPAWLSNGEYVMRSRAHSTFGTAFMNRINNLDVEGAMRALSLRAGSGILSRAKVTNNYTRDNHANVTFNVNRATQGYAQRRASRWARALS